MANQRSVQIKYSAWLGNDAGQRQLYLPQITNVSVNLGLNTAHTANVTFPASVDGRDFDWGYLVEDAWVEIYRSVDGDTPTLLGQTPFILQKPRRVLSETGAEHIELVCYSAAYVAHYPIVAYAAGASQADREGLADSLIKQVAHDNIGASVTDLARNKSDYITIAEDTALSACISMGFSRRKLDSVFNSFAAAATEAGQNLYWDIVLPDPLAASRKLELRTYAGQRGTNRGSTSVNPVIFSKSKGSLTDAIYEEDWSDSEYYIYTGGQGQEENRVVKTASDTQRIGATVWGRSKEYWQDARHLSNPSSVQFEANATLREKRRRITITGKVANIPGSVFERHWFHGDMVQVDLFGNTYDAIVSPISLSYREGVEGMSLTLVVEE
jgi:hypothetical protein